MGGLWATLWETALRNSGLLSEAWTGWPHCALGKPHPLTLLSFPVSALGSQPQTTKTCSLWNWASPAPPERMLLLPNANLISIKLWQLEIFSPHFREEKRMCPWRRDTLPELGGMRKIMREKLGGGTKPAVSLCFLLGWLWQSRQLQVYEWRLVCVPSSVSPASPLIQWRLKFPKSSRKKMLISQLGRKD